MGLWNKGFQPQLVLVDDNTQTITSSGATRSVNLKEKLPDFHRGMIGHTVAFVQEQILDPTYTAAPTLIASVDAITRYTVRLENGRVAFDGGGADLRAFELLENGGRTLTPDPLEAPGTGNESTSTRFLGMGPGGFEGNPTDFMLPNVLAANGIWEQSYDVLTGISADTTAATLRTLTYACVIGASEVRIPPKVERKFWTGAGNALELSDVGLLAMLTMCDTSAHGAIGAGEIGAVTLRDRKGNVFSGIDAESLWRAYQAINGCGVFTEVQGEPRAATDDNALRPDPDTVTAVDESVSAYNPVCFYGGAMRISKIEVEGPFRLEWNGSQAGSHILTTRIQPRSEDEVRDLAVRAHKALRIPFKGLKVKTLSKKPYVGPRAEYMPWDSAVR